MEVNWPFVHVKGSFQFSDARPGITEAGVCNLLVAVATTSDLCTAHFPLFFHPSSRVKIGDVLSRLIWPLYPCYVAREDELGYDHLASPSLLVWWYLGKIYVFLPA